MLQCASPTPSPCRGSSNSGPTANPLVAKLGRFVRLSTAEIAAIDGICGDQSEIAAEQVIIAEGSCPDHLSLIVDGFAYRYKFLPGGRRQILGYLVPGDLCDVRCSVFDRLDYSIASLGESQVMRIPVEKLLELFAAHPAVERALWLAALVDRTILQEWLLNIGQRDAYQKLSHFFCEMSARLKASGWSNSDGSLELPLDQTALADTTGLTLVHINRTLQRMRCEGLIALRRRRLTITDFERLAAITGFDDHYLAPQAPPLLANC
jgi:CRP-like cAMP-binding protein